MPHGVDVSGAPISDDDMFVPRRSWKLARPGMMRNSAAYWIALSW